MKLCFGCGNKPVDYSIITNIDAGIILQQMKGRKFVPELLLGVASRCLKGYPQVVLCKSLLNGIPFPNSFWLSCPILVKIAGRAESLGGVKELELFIRENKKDNWETYNKLHTKIRINLADKNELNALKQNNYAQYVKFCDNKIGMGGIRISKEVNVKCLHLQIASFLSLGFHPGQDWLNDKILSFHLNNY